MSLSSEAHDPALAQRRALELESIHNIGSAIASTLEFEELLRLIYEHISSVLHIDTSFLALYDDDARLLRFELVVDRGVTQSKLTRPLDSSAGISGWIVEHRAAFMSRDLPSEKDLQPGFVGESARSFIGVPLIVKGRLVGIMSVSSHEPDQFDDEHLTFLTAIANQVGMAIENARLFGQVRARAEELAVANQVAGAVNSSLNLEEVLRLFFDRVTVLFNVEAGSLVLHDSLTNDLVFRVVYGGAGESLVNSHIPPGKGIVGWVIDHGESLLVPDVRQDERWFKTVDEHTAFVTQSILAAPLCSQDHTIGAVELINRRDGSPFSESDRRLLELFAASAAMAIENARLHEQTEKRLGQVILLNTLANRLTSSVDLIDILNSTADYLRESFRCNACTIHLADKTNETLEMMASSGQLVSERPRSVRVGFGAVGCAAQWRAPVYIERSGAGAFQFELVPGLESLLVVPLLTRARVLGTLSLESTSSLAFSEDDRRLLTTAAAQISTAIENTQLYLDVQERAVKLTQAYDDLKELDRLKTELIQNVSHELRTPLSLMKGYIELLRMNAMGELSTGAQNALGVMFKNVESLTRMVDDIVLLQGSQAEPLNIGILDITELANTALERARQTNPSGVVLRLESPPHVPKVVGDSRQIARVFDHLIANACKFSPEGGEVLVRIIDAGDCVQVSIQDNGLGIPKDRLAKVFERFYQLDGSATRQFGGLGLGLAVVKRIVEAHQGQIWAESELGKGSIFYFTLLKRKD